MDINELNAVIAVWNFKNFSYAADELSISQSALSKQISDVESELDVRIFDRARRGRPAELTPDGAVLIRYIQNTVNAYYDMVRASSELNLHSEQELTIGFVPSAGTFGEPKVYSRFLTDHPDVHIHFRYASNQRLFDLLQTRTIDAAVLSVPEWDLKQGTEFAERFYRPEYDIIEIRSVDRMALILNENNPLAKERSIGREHYKTLAQQVIILNPKSPYSQRVDDVCRALNIDLPNNIRYMDFDSLGVLYTLIGDNENFLVPFIGINTRTGEGRVIVPVEGWNVRTYKYLVSLKTNKRRSLRSFRRTMIDFAEKWSE